MTIPAICQCCAVCPDCAHHDAWYDEYGSGDEITTEADRKRHAICSQSETLTRKPIPARRAVAWQRASTCCAPCGGARTSPSERR